MFETRMVAATSATVSSRSPTNGLRFDIRSRPPPVARVPPEPPASRARRLHLMSHRSHLHHLAQVPHLSRPPPIPPSGLRSLQRPAPYQVQHLSSITPCDYFRHGRLNYIDVISRTFQESQEPPGTGPSAAAGSPAHVNRRRYAEASVAPKNEATTAPAARKGPNGIACFLPAPAASAPMAPTPPRRIPAPAATPTNRSPSEPRTRPIKAASFTSPIPMPRGEISATASSPPPNASSPSPARARSTPPPASAATAR